MILEQKEFYEKYGDIDVTFSEYYKYIFTFTAKLPNDETLICHIGGSSHDIYRFHMGNGHTESLRSLDPFSGEVYKDGKEICSFYEF